MVSKLNIKILFIILSCLTVGLCEYLYGFETMDTAMQFSKGQVRALFYRSEFRTEPVFQVGTTEEITVVSDGEEFKYFGYTEQSINCSASGNNVVLKLVFNPFNELYWWTKVGSTDYVLEIPNVSVTQKLDSASSGFLVGLGTKYQIFPETIVTPGICLDFGLTFSEHKLNKFYPAGGEMVIVNNKLEIQEFQVTFLMSKSMPMSISRRSPSDRTFTIEPYGGLRVFRHYTKLTDQEKLVQVDGMKDSLAVFIGSRIKLYPLEWIICELGFIGETTLTLGFNCKCSVPSTRGPGWTSLWCTCYHASGISRVAIAWTE